jgi:hypothetical protein
MKLDTSIVTGLHDTVEDTVATLMISNGCSVPKPLGSLMA